MKAFRDVTLSERFLIGWGSIILAIATLYWAKAILVPLVLALLLASILSPMVIALHHCGLRRIPSAILVVLLATALLASIGWTFAAQMQAFINDLPEHKQAIVAKINALQETPGPLANFLRLIDDVGKEVQNNPS